MSPSSHMHQVVGGDAFAASMPTTDISKLGSCTTCHFKEDVSNYWTANLYFRARNGSYKRVPQIANQFNDGDNAGITIYYTSPGPNLTTAFKPVREDNRGCNLIPPPLLIYYFRASACSLATQLNASRTISERRCNNATAVSRLRTLVAACTRHAWTPSWTRITFQSSPAWAAFDPTSSFPCMVPRILPPT